MTLFAMGFVAGCGVCVLALLVAAREERRLRRLSDENDARRRSLGGGWDGNP